jgi:hypothetical protein
VRERQLDIATVPLATVAQQYFDYIAVMDALDVEVAAEYLVIAATLVYLKSKSLLPAIPSEFAPEGEESAEEVEERLRARLIAYSKYKGVAEELRARAAEADAFYFREAGDSSADVEQRYRIVPGKLARALVAAIRTAKADDRTRAFFDRPPNGIRGTRRTRTRVRRFSGALLGSGPRGHHRHVPRHPRIDPPAPPRLRPSDAGRAPTAAPVRPRRDSCKLS